METVKSINDALNGIVWGWPAMILILGVGLFLTVCLKGFQFRKFGFSMKQTIGRLFARKNEGGEGAISPFQAVCTALAGTVGTGNIAGMAGAICLGGPGAVFWMWISAILGMCTKYAEVTLAVHYREKNPRGEWLGGPMFYIKNGLSKGWGWLGILFAVFGALASFGTGNATQVGSIKDSINFTIESFGGQSSALLNWILGFGFCALILVILLGGIKRLAHVTERLVPFMAGLYILMGIGIIILRIDRIPGVFASIFTEAFTPRAAIGGGIFVAMKRGISRGIFSNEAGLGSAPMAHASADTDHPVRQGIYGIFEVFIDTIIICTLTALIILCSNSEPVWGQSAGAPLTVAGLTDVYGSWASVFGAVAICCFAFSTILAWGLYGSRCAEFLFGHKIVKPYIIVYSLITIIGATVDGGIIWEITDTLNGLMALPNLIAVALLAPTVIRLTKDFFAKQSEEKTVK